MCYEHLIKKMHHRRLLLSILGSALTLAIRSQLSKYVTNVSLSPTFLLQKIIFTESNTEYLHTYFPDGTHGFSVGSTSPEKTAFLVWIPGKGSIKDLWSQGLQSSALSSLCCSRTVCSDACSYSGGRVGHWDQKEHAISSLLYACSLGILLSFNFSLIILS